MTLLVISPDYASHLLPLATVATSWRDARERVVVATGPATRTIVDSFGYDWTDLRLGRGSNPGVIRAEEQARGEDDALRGFFAATEHGMVPTLLYQANARLADLLWNPVETARRVIDVVEAVRPDQVIVDHLAFSARLALQAGGVPHATWCSAIPQPSRSATRCTGTRRCGPRRSTRTPGSWPPCSSDVWWSGTRPPPSGTLH